MILLIAGGLPALGTVLGLLGRWSWALDLMSHFRVQYALVLAPVVLLNLFIGRYRVAGVLALPLAINIGLIVPLYVPPPMPDSPPPAAGESPDAQTDADADADADPPTRPTLRLAHLTVDVHNAPMDRLVEYLGQLDADILVLQSISSRWLHTYQFRLGSWMMRHAEPRDDQYGLAVLEHFGDASRPRISAVRVVDLTQGRSTVPALEVEVHWRDRRFMMLALHAAPLHSARVADVRHMQLAGAARWAQRQATPAMIVGNLGATPWSHAFSQLLDTSGLVNSQAGFGIQGTWPAGGGPLGKIPIDHLLHSAEFATVNRKLGPGLGASHHPLLVELQWH